MSNLTKNVWFDFVCFFKIAFLSAFINNILFFQPKHLCKVDVFHNTVTALKGVTSINCAVHTMSTPHNEEVRSFCNEL